MSIPQRIREYLDSQGVAYESLPHPEAYSGQEVAHSLHLSGKKLAKTVVLDADGRAVMAVLPASNRLNLTQFRELVRARHVALLPESELARLFPDCELGAVPPLAHLYGMEVWVDAALAAAPEIVFTAGTHVDAVRMKYEDFERLGPAHIGRFSEPWGERAA